jgi:hypothetical protein
VVFLAVVPVFISTTQPLGWAGKITILCVAGIAVAALLVQGFIQSSKDIENKETTQNLAKRIVDLEKEKHSKESRSYTTDAAPEPPRGPMVYVNVRSQNDGFRTKTEFVLTNHGPDVAHKVHIEPFHMRSGNIEFTGIEILEPKHVKEILPVISRSSIFFKNNLSSLLLKEWDEARRGTSEVAYRMRMLYEDVSQVEYETVFDLIYSPIQDILEKPAFQIRNTKIKRLVQPVAL